jgi:hypothetical protein
MEGLDEGIEPFGESKRDSQSSRTSAMKPDDILKVIAESFFAALHRSPLTSSPDFRLGKLRREV